MANKTMHHVVIGENTYEIVDQYAREHGGATIDSSLSATSTNPVQNKAIYAAAENLKEQIYNSYPTGTAGPASVAVIDDGADDIPVKSLVVGIEPVQTGSGDPSPDNVRPITGWTGANVQRTGKNLKNLEFSRVNSSNILTNVFALKAGTYTLSVNYSGTPTWGVYLRNGRDVDSPAIKQAYNATTLTFTLDKNYSELCVSMYYANGITVSEVTDVKLEIGSTPTSYEPYQGTTYPITFPTEAGTVYGGTLDVTKGILTVDRGFVTWNGSEDWVLSGGKKVRCNIYALQNLIKRPASASEVLEGLQASYLTAQIDNATYQGTVGISCQTNGVVGITLTGEATTVDTVKAYLTEHPLQVVYPLATPITYTLTPTEIKTLLGENRIYADAGDATVEYRVDFNEAGLMHIPKAPTADGSYRLTADVSGGTPTYRWEAAE